MSKLYGESQRRLQHRFDTERIADRIEERLFREHITSEDRDFIQRMDMFFLATADSAGHPNCSYKGGDPGFVRVLDEHTLVFPNYDGNGMYLSMGNASENAHVGMLFIDFEKPKRLRINGMAQLAPADSIEPPYPEAQLIVRVTVRQVFPNCPRYSQDAARRTVEVRAACGGRHTSSVLEADGLGTRCAPKGRPGARAGARRAGSMMFLIYSSLRSPEPRSPNTTAPSAATAADTMNGVA